MTNKLILSNKSKEIIGDTFLTRLSPQDLDKKISEAYLGVLANDKTLFNPFEKIPAVAGDKFAEYVTYIMSQPEYFYFIIKYIFGMETFPQQALILKELYTHKFPLLIGTRGLGKMIRPEEKIRIKGGWTTMEKISIGDKVYGSDGKLCNVIHKTDLQKNLTMYRITLRDGRTIDCCEDHQWKIWSKNKNQNPKNNNIWTVLKTKDLINNYYNIRKDSKSKDGKFTKEYLYAIPVNSTLLEEDDTDLPIHPYIVGALLGDGGLTKSSVILTSVDKELLDRVNLLLPNGYLLKDVGNGKDYRIIRKNKDLPPFNFLCKKIGIHGLNSHNKHIPDIYKFSSSSQKIELLKGLMDTDGYSNKDGTIEYYTVSNNLSNDIQDVIRSLGISCRHSIKESWLNNKRYADCNVVRIYTDKEIFYLSRKLQYLKHIKSKAGQSKYKKIFITNIEKIENGNGYCIQVDSSDNTYITKDYIVTHNSVSLALYMLIRMILIPGTRCIITSAGFRQAKVVFDYMERIWDKAPILQSCFKGGKNGPTHGTDVWTFRLGDSLTYALPVGPDGSKVRGYRANCVHGDTLIQTDKGLIKIRDFNNKKCEAVININKGIEIPKSFYNTEPTDVYELVTERGYSIKFSEIHQLNGPSGWIKANELKVGDLLELDNNDFFPKDYARHGENILDEREIFFSGLINLSTFSAKEVPWYILQSPRNIVYRYLKMVLGEHWLNKTIKSTHKEKLCQLQILLLKFNFISCVKEEKDGRYSLTVEKQHLTQDMPTDRIISINKLPEKESLYDFELLETNSFRGGGFVNHNCLISDEFSSMNRQVFEEVMSGFLTVAASPVEQIKQNARRNLMKLLYIPIPISDTKSDFLENQLILSGTAYYKINHFYSYFNKWNQIIMSKNDPKLLKDMFKDEADTKNINPDSYSIIRIPVELTAHGYMDMDQVTRIKASTTKDVFLREYSACFNDDSDGFFKKSLIDSCTAEDGDKDCFPPALYGTKVKKYVYGVDPAYEGDNFAVVILELNGSHRRVVHTWTTQASDHKQRLRDGVITEHDYYHYCARKIRDLMKRFPCEYIALDSQGGGNALMEAFRDVTKINENESVILPTIEPEEKTKETDLMPGLHIIKVINFTSDWISKANYALKKDMEDKAIRFPMNDAVSYALSEYYDESMGDSKELYDTLDDCIFEIEELKKELTTIVVSETTTGREKFDTPSIKVGINRKGRLKKDRYSALLMANAVARELLINDNRTEGGDIFNLSNYIFTENKTKLFRGNSKIADQLNKLYGNM